MSLIPPEVWDLPEMRQAWEKRDASTIIRLRRWNTDLFQIALSRMTGLAQPTVSDVISGKIEFKHHDRIAQAIDGLGEPPLLEQVLARYDSTYGREMALYLSWLAVTYADANEPEEAARVATRMMAHARGLGSDRTMEHERMVRSKLWRFRDVGEARDVLEPF